MLQQTGTVSVPSSRASSRASMRTPSRTDATRGRAWRRGGCVSLSACMMTTFNCAVIHYTVYILATVDTGSVSHSKSRYVHVDHYSQTVILDSVSEFVCSTSMHPAVSVCKSMFGVRLDNSVRHFPGLAHHPPCRTPVPRSSHLEHAQRPESAYICVRGVASSFGARLHRLHLLGWDVVTHWHPSHQADEPLAAARARSAAHVCVVKIS